MATDMPDNAARLRAATRRKWWTLAALIAVLVVLATGSLIWFLSIRAMREPGDLDRELAKALIQIGIVSVAAAIVSLLVFHYQHQTQEAARIAGDERDERRTTARTTAQETARVAEKERDQERQKAERQLAEEARLAEKERDERQEKLRADADKAARRADHVDELLKSTLTRITSSYNAVKRARRELRALARYKSDSGETMIRAAVYDECMARLNDAQLDLEAVKRDISLSRGAYPSAKEMLDCVGAMEKYVRRVTKEYEKNRWKTDSDLPLTPLARLTDFLAKRKESEPFKRFVSEYSKVRTLTRKNLMNVRYVDFEEPPAGEVDDAPEDDDD